MNDVHFVGLNRDKSNPVTVLKEKLGDHKSDFNSF